MLELSKYEGKSKEEALAKCLEALHCKENDLYLKYSESEAKLFKAKKYYVEALKKEDVYSYLKEYISKLAEGMRFEIHSEIKEVDGIYNVLLVSENNPILIGKEGRTMHAIQVLLRNSLEALSGFSIKVVVDVAGYKAKKQRNLEYEVKKIAKDVLRSKIEVKLDPMNSYDRRIVHSVVSTFENLETESFGESPNRYVVIRYKEEK